MTYLCIASAPGATPCRRVDLNDLAAIFAEDDVCETVSLSRATSAMRVLLRPIEVFGGLLRSRASTLGRTIGVRHAAPAARLWPVVPQPLDLRRLFSA